MKKSLLMFTAFVMLSAPALAQESQSEEVTSLLVPSSAWLVGPTTLADGSPAEGGMPCVMVNKYSNDIEMRLSGGGQALMAMALTFPANTFQKDQSYLMSISFPDQELIQLPAQAFSESTLVIGTEPGQTFYKSLQSADAMTLILGSNKMEFSLLGVKQGLKRMEDCYNPAGTQAAAAVPAQQPVVAPGMRSLDKNPPAVAAPEEEPSSSAPSAPDDKLGSMIDKVAEKTLPASKPETPAAEPYEPIVQQEEKEPEAPKNQEVKPRDILAPSSTASVSGEGQEMRWRVMKGANLQSILEVWTQSAQARLIWKADQGFSVRESVALQGKFESAVEAVLGQFPLSEVRPVGKIYIDLVMKQKVLVIEADKPQVPATAEGQYESIGEPKL